jgi:hypothetical protein
MGRKEKRVAARQLTSAMTWIEPPVAKGGKGGDSVLLIDTRTISAGRVNGVLKDERRESLTSGLKSISSLLGKLRWGAGVLVNKYILSKLSLGPEHNMLPDLDQVEIAGCRRSGRAPRRPYVADADSDNDEDEKEAAEEGDADVISLEVVHDALRCLMLDSSREAPYKLTKLYSQLCMEREVLHMRDVLGDAIDGKNLSFMSFLLPNVC